MKHVIVALLFLPFFSKAQSPMYGLFCNHYFQTTGTNADLRRINKPISIIYNRDYCWFDAPNGDMISFRTLNYSKEVNSSTKNVHESFMNDDSQTTRSGFYMIMIDMMNDGTTFQISSPSGTIVVQGAEVISENGQVKDGAIKINWKAVRAAERKADSILSLSALREAKFSDSMSKERIYESHLYDSLLIVAKNHKIVTGQTPPLSWLISVTKNIKD